VGYILIALVLRVWYSSDGDVSDSSSTASIGRHRELSLQQFHDPATIDNKLVGQVEEEQLKLNEIANTAIENGNVAFRVFQQQEHESQQSQQLRQAKQQKQSYYEPILIEIVNPKLNHYYSVTITSYNKYTKTATLLDNDDERSTTLVYSWTPFISGTNDILVHEISSANQNGDKTQLVQPGVYPIYIPSSVEDKKEEDHRNINALPPCQTIESPILFTHFDGHWLGPDFKSTDSLRNGWSFVPSLDSSMMGSREKACKIETFSYDEIQSIPKKKKIYVLGTSIHRGIFLSLVDMMLDKAEKEELSSSIIQKCWGRMTVKKNNLEVTYQDWRVSEFESPSMQNQPPFIECHNEKLSKEKGMYYANATEIWSKIWNGSSDEWPDVIYMLQMFARNKASFQIHTLPLLEMIPSSWTGVLFLGDGTFSAAEGGLQSRSRYRQVIKDNPSGLVDQSIHKLYSKDISAVVSSINDSRIRYVDGIGASKEHRMYGESGPDHILQSQHFHRMCEKVDQHNPDNVMTVCSNVTELMGQLLIGHAVGPKAELEATKKDVSKSPTPLRWCHACPSCMLPFKLMPDLELTCHEGPITKKDENIIIGGCLNPCPKSCLKQEVSRTFASQSDEVYVRQCPISSLW